MKKSFEQNSINKGCCGLCYTQKTVLASGCINPSCKCHSDKPVEKDYMVNNNFLQVQSGGHCFYCHADFTEKIFEHDCWQKKKYPLSLTSCTDKCKDSPYLKGRTTGNLTPIPPTKAPSWEDKIWISTSIVVDNVAVQVKRKNDEIFLDISGSQEYHVNITDVFPTNLALTSERTRLLEGLGKMRKSQDKKDHFIPGKPGATHRAKRAVGYNLALSQVETLIKGELK